MDATSSSVDVGDAEGLWDDAERQISRAARHAAAVVARHRHHRTHRRDGSGGRENGHRDGAQVGAGEGSRHHRRQQQRPPQQECALGREELRSLPDDQPQHWHQHQHMNSQSTWVEGGERNGPSVSFAASGSAENYHPEQNWDYSADRSHPQHHHDWSRPRYSHLRSGNSGEGEQQQQRRYINSEHGSGSGSGSFNDEGGTDVVYHHHTQHPHPPHDHFSSAPGSEGGTEVLHHHHPQRPHPPHDHFSSARGSNCGTEVVHDHHPQHTHPRHDHFSSAPGSEGGTEVVHDHHPQHPHPPRDHVSSAPRSGQLHQHRHPPELPPQSFHGSSSTPSAAGRYGNGSPSDGLNGQEYYHQRRREEYNPHHQECTVPDGPPLHMHPDTQRHGYVSRPPPNHPQHLTRRSAPAAMASASSSSQDRQRLTGSGSGKGHDDHRTKTTEYAAAAALTKTRIAEKVEEVRGRQGARERCEGGACKGVEATDDVKDGQRGRGGSDDVAGGGVPPGSATRPIRRGREGPGDQTRPGGGDHLPTTENCGRASLSAPSSLALRHAGFDLAAEVGSLHPQSKYRALVDQLLAKQKREVQAAQKEKLDSVAAKCKQHEMAPKKPEKKQKVASNSIGDANSGAVFDRGGKKEHTQHGTSDENRRKRQRPQHERMQGTVPKRVRWLTPKETLMAERVKAKRDQLASRICANNSLVALICDCEQYRKHREQLGACGNTTDQQSASFSSIRLSTDQDALREELERMQNWFLHELTPQEQNQHLKMAVPKLIAVNQAACESIRNLHAQDMQSRVDKSSSILTTIRQDNQKKLRRRKQTFEKKLLAARRGAEKLATQSDMVARLKMEAMEGTKERLRKSWNVEANRLRTHHEKIFRKDLLTMKASCEKERIRKRAFLDSVVQHFTLRLKEMEAFVGKGGLHSSRQKTTCSTVNENEKKDGKETIPCERLTATEVERSPAADEIALRTISTLKQDVCRLKASLITYAQSRRRRLLGEKNDQDEKVLADLEERYKELLIAFENNADFYGWSYSTEVEPPVQHPCTCVPGDEVLPARSRCDHYRREQEDEDNDLSDVGITLSDIEEVEKLVKRPPRSPVKTRKSAASSSSVVDINPHMENTSESELMYLSDFSFLSC